MVQPMEARCPAIRFVQEAIEDRDRSIECGRMIKKNIDMVYVRQNGDKDEVPRVATEYIEQMRKRAMGEGNQEPIPMAWYDRLLLLYENFQKGNETPPDGMPVREWVILSPAQVQNLHSMGTFTIEEVAAWNESSMGRYGMGGRELRDKARMWLESGDKKAEQITALQAEIAALKVGMDSMSARLKEADTEDSPKRGRPRKEAETT